MSATLLAPSTNCSQPWRERPYRESLTLHNGRQVLLRPAHRSDADALQQFFAALSPRSRLLRFHGAVNRVPDSVLRVLTTQVPERHVALVAVAHTDDGTAEFAVTVADAWQRLGLGRALLQRLAVHARANGIAVLRGSVVPGNEAMLSLMTGLGAELRGDASEVQAQWLL